MARDWSNIAATFADLEKRLAEIAPDNSAPIPLACAMEQDEAGNWGWVVDAHVRRKGITEYEVTGVGKTLAGALRRCYLGLSNEPRQNAQGRKANDVFGVAV